MTHKVSIALATHNGERYLPDMLSSLLNQHQMPYELIACDDASDDKTLSVLESFADKAPFTVKVFCNSTRIGVTRNFSRAISLCSSEFIALADQDDVWMTDKLEQVQQALASTGGAAVFSDAEVVSEDLHSLAYTMWERIHFNTHEQELMRTGRAFDVLLKHRVVTGATLCFRQGLCGDILPIPPQWPHDAWIAAIAAAHEGLHPISKPLVRYRQHQGNVTGGLRKSLWEEVQAAKNLNRNEWYREELERLHLLIERLEATSLPALIQEKLAGKISHLETRASLPETRLKRLPQVVVEVVTGRYAAYSRNWGSIAIDLLIR